MIEENMYEDEHEMPNPIGLEAFIACCWCKKFKTCKNDLKHKIINYSCEQYDDDIEKIMKYLKLSRTGKK